VNATHRKILTAVFAEPVSASLEWRRVEAMLVAVDQLAFKAIPLAGASVGGNQIFYGAPISAFEIAIEILVRSN
jgi:hypothetical protein